jgi:hypothetical protein
MITLKFKGNNPDHIREQVKTVFGLVDPAEAGTPVAVQAKVDEVIGASPAPAPAPQPLAAEPAKRGRKPRDAGKTDTTLVEEPAKPDTSKPSTQNAGDELNMPAFLDRRTAPEAAPAAVGEPAPAAEIPATLEQLRAKLSELLAKRGNSPDIVFKMIGAYPQPDGKPCAKASQVADADRAKLIADIDAELAKK